ncbi:hypothetical protein LV89_04992 [Arcicella aurantiaca]|uniref:Uncharacterized protein n=1 Tax=Arcicella aurantiaca TaxID=591202 RepID=A0A316DFW0_9BACT|nr:DUF6607 family protein [Arcicella aurantiaca]PWK15054.1 hypothetical protein LV89_04992 [Arcicella aurantiaca]
MKKTIWIALFLCLTIGVRGQKKEDITAIKGQCGCFDVKFSYAETFSPQKDYKFHERYITAGREYVFVDEETKDKMVLMHLLVIGDTMVIKHWREDWDYQNTNLLAYQKETEWKPLILKNEQVKGQWTQAVFEVNDMPRYTGSATWNHADGKHLWENITDAPLPRREYTKRSDYQVLKRFNRIHVTENGYLHEQDNDKIIRNGNEDKLLVQEKGLNNYVKIEESKCEIAKEWWQKQRPYWVDVRSVWGNILAKNQGLKINPKSTDGKMLWKEIDDLVKNFEKNKVADSNQRKVAINELIEKYLVK